MPLVENPHEWPIFSIYIGDNVYPGEPVEVSEEIAEQMCVTGVLRRVRPTSAELRERVERLKGQDR